MVRGTSCPEGGGECSGCSAWGTDVRRDGTEYLKIRYDRSVSELTVDRDHASLVGAADACDASVVGDGDVRLLRNGRTGHRRLLNRRFDGNCALVTERL